MGKLLKLSAVCAAAVALCAAGCGVEVHNHLDVNGDGVCDGCGERTTVELSFYAINDLHGKYIDTDVQPGVDEFTAYMKALYADPAREEILLSSGDTWQGTVESSTNKGRLLTEWMNELNFVSMTLGNHEYDWGSQVLKPNSELAEFPFLAINVTYNGKPADYCRASTVVERCGVKIGIIGAIGDCLSSISGDFTAGLKFATGSALTSLVKAESEKLRDEGCEFIVYSIHDGYGKSFSASSVNEVSSRDVSSYYDVSLSDGYVDLVFEGHTHQRYILKDEHGVYHLQGGGENSFVSSAEVSLNRTTREFTVKPKLISSSVYAGGESDPVVGELFDKYFPNDNPYTTVLGSNAVRRNSSEVCTLLAKLYYQTGAKQWGGEYKIALGGGYLKLRSPYRIEAGSVTYAQLFSVLPFDNDIVLGKIKGSDLKSRFLSGADNYYCFTVLKASEISDDSYYYIIVDSYSSTYRYNRITEVARLVGEKYARDLLADFVAGGGWKQ